MFSEIARAVRHAPWGQTWRALLCVAFTGWAVGCGKEQVAVYEVPKDQPTPAANTAAARDPHGGMTVASQLEWVAPSAWEAQPAGGMRLANYLVTGNSQTGQVSVLTLSGVVGEDLQVLNIFRERLRVPPLEVEELAQLGQDIAIGSDTGRLYDMLGEQTGGAAETGDRLLVAVLQGPRGSHYFTFFGPASLVEAEKPEFVALLDSVVVKTAPTASGPAPMTPAPIGGGMGGGTTAASARPDWTVPEGWREVQPTQMLLARFLAGAEGGQAEITVSVFPGNVGGTTANVNRWRGQIGLPPLEEVEMKAMLGSLEVEGGSASMVDLVGPEGKRLIGVIWPQGSRTWFYKMLGDDAVVAREKTALIQFVQSVRHPDA